MGFTVRILDTRTGVACPPIPEDGTWDDDTEEGHASVFFWTEGNFGCDCNRELFHARAVNPDGPDPYEDEDEVDGPSHCGTERFKIRVEAEGRIVYDEWPAEACATIAAPSAPQSS